MGFISGDVTGVMNQLHEECREEEESKNGTNESKSCEVFFRNQSLVLLVHGFEFFNLDQIN